MQSTPIDHSSEITIISQVVHTVEDIIVVNNFLPKNIVIRELWKDKNGVLQRTNKRVLDQVAQAIERLKDYFPQGAIETMWKDFITVFNPHDKTFTLFYWDAAWKAHVIVTDESFRILRGPLTVKACDGYKPLKLVTRKTDGVNCLLLKKQKVDASDVSSEYRIVMQWGSDYDYLYI